MIIVITITLAIIGIIASIKAKKLFEKGLCESDSYQMIVEFNKSKKIRRFSTITLITAMFFFAIFIIQLILTSKIQ